MGAEVGAALEVSGDSAGAGEEGLHARCSENWGVSRIYIDGAGSELSKPAP